MCARSDCRARRRQRHPADVAGVTGGVRIEVVDVVVGSDHVGKGDVVANVYAIETSGAEVRRSAGHIPPHLPPAGVVDACRDRLCALRAGDRELVVLASVDRICAEAHLSPAHPTRAGCAKRQIPIVQHREEWSTAMWTVKNVEKRAAHEGVDAFGDVVEAYPDTQLHGILDWADRHRDVPAMRAVGFGVVSRTPDTGVTICSDPTEGIPSRRRTGLGQYPAFE